MPMLIPQNVRTVVSAQSIRMLTMMESYTLRMTLWVTVRPVSTGRVHADSGKSQDILMDKGRWGPGLMVGD